MKMRKLAELISVATRKDWEAFEGGGLLASLGGVYSGSLSLRMSLLISSRRDFCYFLCSAFKIVLQKSLTW